MLLPLCVHAVREASWAETDQMWSEPRSGRGQRCRAVAGWGCTFTEPYTNFIQSRGRSSSKNTNASHVVFLQQQQEYLIQSPRWLVSFNNSTYSLFCRSQNVINLYLFTWIYSLWMSRSKHKHHDERQHVFWHAFFFLFHKIILYFCEIFLSWSQTCCVKLSFS